MRRGSRDECPPSDHATDRLYSRLWLRDPPSQGGAALVTILKVPRLWPGLQVSRAAAAHAAAPAPTAADGLDAFGSESDPAPKVRMTPPPPAPKRPPQMPRLPKAPKWLTVAGKWSAVVVLTAALAVSGVFLYQKRFAATANTGSVTLETTPSGLDVVLAGKSLGKTPVTTSLTPGPYEMQVGSAPNIRTIKVNVTAGTSIVQRIEFADALVAPVVTGGLRVQTEPSHLPVFVDGTAHGVSPVSVDELQPGEHDISVRTSAGTVRRSVTIQPRETVSLIVSSTAPPPDPGAVAAGWIAVTSPIVLQLREGGKLIGTSESDRVMLTAGDHDIEFGNEALGFTGRRTLHVNAGKTTATKVDLPNGSLSINAQPWAEVFVDGERVGETPIGNLTRRIGTHEVIFRHPDLGERKETVVVGVGKPARIGVDLRKK